MFSKQPKIVAKKPILPSKNVQENKNLQNKPKAKWINPLKDRTRVVPFIVPDHQRRMAALGSLAGQNWKIKKSLQEIIDDFQPVKQPQPGDNLYEYQQDGQDYPLFSSINRNHIDKQTQIIYIIPFKCNLSKEIIKQIKNKSKAFFHGVKVKTHQLKQNIDLGQFNPRVSQNGQTYYDAAKMNVYFTKILPKNTYSVAIITSLLIYNGDRVEQNLSDVWVFGLGSIKDRTSITSYQEVLKKGYGGKKQQQDDQSQFNRQMLSKIVNHELCHTFSMKHCIYFSCLMNGSNGYHQASIKQLHLCPICLRKLQSQLKFDFAQRFDALGDEKSLQLAHKVRKALNLEK